MINSIWSLCGACPSLPSDKIPAEYRHVRNRRQGWNQSLQENGKQESYPVIDSEPSGQGILEPLVPPTGSSTAAAGNIYESNESVEFEPSNGSYQTGMELSSGSTKSEYNVKFGWPPSGQTPQRSEPVKPVEVLAKLLNSSDCPKKSSSMNVIQPAQTRQTSNFGGNNADSEASTLINGDGDFEHEADDERQARRQYKTEYRRKFRPFSLYQYVDGHFEKARSVGDPIASDEADTTATPVDPGKGAPWHKEVTELRKKATEFKQRGWGIESLPEHLHSLYVEQGTVWDQVSRRSTLAALALASATPRSTSRDGSEPSRRIQTKSGRDESSRNRARDDSARPRRDHSIAARSDRSTMSAPVDRRSLSAGKHRPPLAVSSAPTSAQSTPKIRLGAVGRSVSVGREARAKRAARTPTSVGPPAPQMNGDVRQTRRKPEQDVGRLDSSLDATLKDEILLHPLQKAPAEPTRVKSPETLLVRSPDPVNWTVPIETTKPLNPVQGIKQNPDGPRCLGELRVTMNVRPLEKPINQPVTAPISAGVRFKKPLEEMIPPSGHPIKHPIETHPKPSSVVSPMKAKDVNANADASVNGHKLSSPQDTARFESSPLKSPDSKKFAEKSDIPVGKVEPIRVQPMAKPIPGTTLRCLEDPSFLFDMPKPVIPPSTEKVGGTKVIEPVTQQYRVLEAEGVPSDVLYQPTSFSHYKVLEAPSSPKDIVPPLVSPSSGKSLASDVLEKARSRFDRFWGKKDGV